MRLQSAVEVRDQYPDLSDRAILEERNATLDHDVPCYQSTRYTDSQTDNKFKFGYSQAARFRMLNSRLDLS